MNDQNKEFDDVDHEDDEPDSVTATGAYFQTKNELEIETVVPDIQHVGPEEELEIVGNIMSVISNSVIVKGIPSGVVNRGSERALDSDTLLVFEDRSVMGYVSDLALHPI